MTVHRSVDSIQTNQNMKIKKESVGRILLVDDEPNILIALEFLMIQQGYEIKTAKDGKEALSIMQDFLPNVILLDVMMPGMDGFEVAKTIRKEMKFATTQIIFLTAKGTKEDRREGYKSGGEIFLTKPFDNDELIEAVAHAFKI